MLEILNNKMSDGQISLYILYNGQKKAFSLNPNTILQTTLAEAAVHFKLDVNRCKLKQRSGAFVDCSQSFRFSTLSKNAQLELVQTTATISSSTATCRLALSIIPTSSNITMTVSATLSLDALLSSLANEGKVPANLFDLSPELIYLRSTYTGEAQLTATTLQSLGLENQSVRMQLRYLSRPTTDPIASRTIESPSQNSHSVTQRQPAPSIESIAVVSPDDILTPPSLAAVETLICASEPPLPIEASMVNTPVAPEAAITIVPTIHTVATEAVSLQPLPPSDEGTSTKAAPHRELSDPRQCIASVLSQNLDAVTLPAVLTLYKYIQNILGDPTTMKFRTINTANKNFVAKVASAKGYQEFLLSAGFVPTDAQPNTIVYTPPITSASSTSGYAAVIEELEPLFRAQEALLYALRDLDTDPEAAPYTKEIVLQRLQQASSSSSRQETAFDPFKATVVRTAPQPIRMESATEKQLQELQQKRRELEGDPQSVERSTVVSLPSQQPSGNNKQTINDSEEIHMQQAMGSSAPSGTGSGSITGGIMKKILQSGKEEDAPLTTKAVRDLQRLQKERVYSRTLIKVRFPDGVTVQGYFHPRHSMRDVCEWLQDCLAAGDANRFELYTSPPRTVVAVSHTDNGSNGTISKCERSKISSLKAKSEDSSEDKTLHDFGFVPAVLLHLAWVKEEGFSREKASTTSSSIEAIGSYLKEELLVAADIFHSSKDSSSSSSSSSAAAAGKVSSLPRSEYPVGERLVRQEGAADSAQPKGGNNSKSDDTNSSASSCEQKDKKPKWFKI